MATGNASHPTVLQTICIPVQQIPAASVSADGTAGVGTGTAAQKRKPNQYVEPAVKYLKSSECGDDLTVLKLVHGDQRQAVQWKIADIKDGRNTFVDCDQSLGMWLEQFLKDFKDGKVDKETWRVLIWEWTDREGNAKSSRYLYSVSSMVQISTEHRTARQLCRSVTVFNELTFTPVERIDEMVGWERVDLEPMSVDDIAAKAT